MIKTLIEQLEKMQGAKFVSFTYLANSTGELARHTIRMNVDYVKICQDDILELEIRLKDASGIEAVVIRKVIDSLNESINARKEGREHINYSKKGIYRQICPGIKLNLNDNTLELCGFSHAKKVLSPGTYRTVNHRSEETRIKSVIEKTLKKGKFRTYRLDEENAKSVRLNGEEIIFE